jgi:DNA repair protein RecO (recombination protein O)
MAAAQLFAYADLVIAEGRGFHSLAQASVIESFYNLRNDYDALCCAHVIMEICEKTVLESENCDGLLRLALKALGYLHKSTPTLPPLQVLSVFILRFFTWYGLAPSLDTCGVCGKAVGDGSQPDDPAPFFNPEGVFCRRHMLTAPAERPAINDYQPLSLPALAAMRYISNNDLSKAFLFSVSPGVVQEIRDAAQLLWRHHFEWGLKSLKLL